MMQKTPDVGPFLRIIASIYDCFLLLGIWFVIGSVALWLNGDPGHSNITLKQTFLRYLVNCGMLALLGMPLFLIYVDPKKLAVNDILSKTKLIKV